MAPENRETMQKGLEASLGCFQAKNFIYGPHCPRTFNGQTLDIKYTISGKQANIDSENSEKLSTRPKTYYVWPVHPQSHPLDASHIYPGNRGSYVQTQWVPQVPIHMVPQSFSPDYLYQDFHYFVVIDFEATCDKEKNPHPQEIIEFPSVIVNTRTGQLEDCFQIYVRPTHNQMLSEFCKELTGIQQSQVDKGVLLSEALLMHDKWLEEKGIKKTSFAVVTWSNWDCRVMLESECRFKRIRKPPYFNRWINLKIPFNNLFGFGRRNLKEAVELAGLTWEGRAHCGLDDAKNTARLLAHLMYRGFKFSITDSLQWQSADHPTSLYHNPPQIPTPKNQIPSPENNLAYQSHKWKTSPFTYIPFLPFQEPPVYCLCGAQSVKRVSQKAGPHQGCSFFGCGNWTANRGPVCSFFKWVAVEPVSDPGKPCLENDMIRG